MAGRSGTLEDLVTVPSALDSFYRGKRVLITGHTGFKGGWLSLWLKSLGAEVWGYGLPAPTQPALYGLVRAHCFQGEQEGDVTQLEGLQRTLETSRTHVLFHLGAQPLVRKSYVEPLQTFHANAIGTATLMEAVRLSRCATQVVVVTTDKCYENVGKAEGYRETDPLGGHDVYSSSKAAAELAVQSWRRCFFQTDPALGGVATARGGNVIGGGDYAQDRLVPDAIRSLMVGEPIPVRNPAATRPWQHVLDCLSGYLWLGAQLARSEKTSPINGAFNFGPNPEENKPVQEVIEGILKLWPGQWNNLSVPGALHEASKLNLSISKASTLLGWKPVWPFQTTLEKTVQWYHARHKRLDSDPAMLSFTLEQIASFETSARQQGLAWASEETV